MHPASNCFRRLEAHRPDVRQGERKTENGAERMCAKLRGRQNRNLLRTTHCPCIRSTTSEIHRYSSCKPIQIRPLDEFCIGKTVGPDRAQLKWL